MTKTDHCKSRLNTTLDKLRSDLANYLIWICSNEQCINTSHIEDCSAVAERDKARVLTWEDSCGHASQTPSNKRKHGQDPSRGGSFEDSPHENLLHRYELARNVGLVE